MDDEDGRDTYAEFMDRVERYSLLGDVADHLQWDQEVVMPAAGTPARSRQLGALSGVTHELLTEPPMGAWLDSLEEADLDPDQEAMVREVGRKYERAEAVPGELVEAISTATSEAHPVWREAKEGDDFASFEPVLSELIDLKREYAAHIDPDRPTYAVLFEEFEPYLQLETADRVLTELREELVPLLADIRDSDRDIPAAFPTPVPEETQQTLVRTVLEDLGYDWDRGRLDSAPHPFSIGTPYDARVTTRYDPADPLSALTSTIHEFGHATYTQGLPDDQYGTPLGTARDLTVHESQSRFFENHVGRSQAFFEYIQPTLAKTIDGFDATPRECFLAANAVDDTSLIRVETDEVSYHLHVLIRYELERSLLDGDLAVSAIPEAWNDRYESYLDVRPDTDSEGCLQDIHWSHGSFGYFPTYSLGSVLAAQINRAMREDLAVDELVAEGRFEPIRAWLGEHVHQHGCRYRTDELIERATGEPLTATYFVAYLREKYGRIYDI